jgi:diguanylate cyclase (GGDEF)-like protein
MTAISSPARPRILLIDDIPDNIEVLGKLLINAYDVQFALSGEEGLALISASAPDLILLDVMMPGMDGYEVCRRLKANVATRQIPVIFVTAKDKEDEEEYGLSVGAVDYITKPFNSSIVRIRIKNQITLKHHADLLESLAMIDALTHLPNRRRFDVQLDIECKLSKRDNTPLSLLVLDIDYFKQYNDHYGHALGDVCLQKVSAIMAQAIVRPADLLVRYGGEEFVVILPQTNSEGAHSIAEKMRQAVERLQIRHDYSNTATVVTLSAGCATRLPDDAICDPLALFNAADYQLYRAKTNGRNRVES